MERTLCVWFPDWPLRRPEVRPDEPWQVVGEEGRVAAATPPALRAGVRAGMPRREAELRCPDVTTLLRDPGAEAVAFEPVVAAVEALVPRVEVAEPGALFVPVRGAIRYYRGEAALVGRVTDAVREVAGPGARIGVAAGPFAARWAAGTAESPRIVEDDAAFLRSLDLGSLEREELVATFRWLGLSTLGDLARLPRAAVVSRFGAAGLEAHRLASGEDRPLAPRPLPEDLSVEERFEDPLLTYERVGFAVRTLAHRLVTLMNGHGTGFHRVEIEAEAAGGALRRRVWRSGDPFDESALADRVWWQLRAWSEGEGLPGGLLRLRIVPADLSGRGRQPSLGEDPHEEAEARRALARAQALLGADAVLEARPQGGRDPAERVRWRRWDEPDPPPERDPGAPWPGRLPDPSPSLTPPEPQRVEVEWEGGLPTRMRLASRWVEVLAWAGPWRSLGRWWEGEDPADRYQIVTSAGAFLCEVRRGHTYLVGVYD